MFTHETIEAAAWDQQYQRGYSDYLDSFNEQIRYLVLASMITGRNSPPTESVLDLGCGTGVLHDYLSSESLQRYTGIDLSAEAIEQGRLKARPRATFVAAGIDEWEPDARYDAIVFNEVLYYLPSPTATVARYALCLKEQGAIYVSMWHPATIASLRQQPRGLGSAIARARTFRIWRALSNRYESAANVIVQRTPFYSWRIRELRPRDS